MYYFSWSKYNLKLSLCVITAKPMVWTFVLQELKYKERSNLKAKLRFVEF